MTDRQRELMWGVAHLDRPDNEFTVQELVSEGKRPFMRLGDRSGMFRDSTMQALSWQRQ